MRSSIIILFIYFTLPSLGQGQDLKGIWISPTDDMILIHDTTIAQVYGAITEFNDEMYPTDLAVVNDTLRLWNEFQNGYPAMNYLFRIIEVTDLEMKLVPISRVAINALGSDTITFLNELSFKAPIDFKRFSYVDSLIYGEEERCFVEIRQNGQIKVRKKERPSRYGREPVLDQYIDTLTYRQLRRFKYILSTSLLDRYNYQRAYNPWNWTGVSSHSTPTYQSYQIEIGNELIEFSTPGSGSTLSELNRFLLEICNQRLLEDFMKDDSDRD